VPEPGSSLFTVIIGEYAYSIRRLTGKVSDCSTYSGPCPGIALPGRPGGCDFVRNFAIGPGTVYPLAIKVKLICGKYLAIFSKTETGYIVSCPELPYLRITADTLKETERLVTDTVRGYIHKADTLAYDMDAFVRVNKLWKDVVVRAVAEIERKAPKKGWAINTFVNKRGFNQINRFNRSCSIRTVGVNETTRKLTIGWRAGSGSFSYGNTLAVSGWKNVPHAMISFDTLVEDLAQRLLV
jgi:predicted RNase H-like HicB family nuclease